MSRVCQLCALYYGLLMPPSWCTIPMSCLCKVEPTPACDCDAGEAQPAPQVTRHSILRRILARRPDPAE